MIREKILQHKIEQSRKELLDLASRSSFQSSEVIQASMLLDEILNEYEGIRNNKKQ